MLPDEVLLSQKGNLCGFCENMYAEALHIYQNRLKNPESKEVVKLYVVPQRQL
jgi:hypothetical protein